MSTKFKVGDRVVKTSGYGGDGTAAGTVVGLYPSGSLQVNLDKSHPLLRTYSQDEIECYALLSPAIEPPPAETELERLVRVANEGFRAADCIYSRGLQDQLECGSDNREYMPVLSVQRSPGWNYRIKPAPKFESFYVGPGGPTFDGSNPSGQWLVKLEGETLHIGCQKFNAKNALDVLRLHCSGGCVAAVFPPNGGDSKPSGATRHGIELDGRVLPWADADKILAALEKAGV